MALFIALMKAMPVAEDKEEALYNLCELRAQLLINHAITGIGIDFDKAMDLLKNGDDSNLTLQDREIRDRLVAAVDNLVEFATCEEYQLYEDIQELDFDLQTEEWDEDDSEFMDDYLALCGRYNDQYADVENGDVEYAMAMAAIWIGWNANTYITYMTQNDDRVRPWHYDLQGFTARRDEFPEWMIPPIEWACRCYLVAGQDYIGKLDIKNVKGQVYYEKPEGLDGVFKESVCKCGRIFSDEHPYFDVKDTDKDMLNNFVKRIKEQYYGSI